MNMIETPQSAFKFRESDLLENQQGRLTAHQHEVLKSIIKDFVYSILIISFFPFLLLMWPLSSLDIVAIIFVIGLVVSFVTVYIWTKYKDYRDDMNSGIVENICDRVFLKINERYGRHRTTTYKMTIGKHTFNLSQSQFLVFENGKNYCVYYAPKTKTILSVEKTLLSKKQEHQPLSQQRFGEHAQNYVTSQSHAKGTDLDRLVDLAQPQPDWHVLDVATGGGHTALKFASHVAHVVASDLTPQMLQAAETHITGKGVTNVEFKQANAESLPFDDNTFDLVTCRIAPHHFDDVAQFIREAARVVKPGHLVLVQDHVLPDDTHAARYIDAFEKLRDPSHNRAFSAAEWRTMFERAGLTVAHTENIHKRHPFYDWCERQGVTAPTVACLESLIHHAPSPVTAWLQPRDFGTLDATFGNNHIIIAGEKRE